MRAGSTCGVTVAEVFDNLVVGRFYELLTWGMLVRMIDAQIACSGRTPALRGVRERAAIIFDARSRALAAELSYSVIPIRKLASVQLGSALLAAGHAAQRHA